MSTLFPTFFFLFLFLTFWRHSQGKLGHSFLARVGTHALLFPIP